MTTDNFTKLGTNAFAKMDKINSELFALTYGSMVSQLIRDHEDTETVNSQLVEIGKNIGSKLVDEVLAKLGCAPCTDFKSTVEVIAKVGFKMFLGISGDVVTVNERENIHNIKFQENPLDQFVELPDSLCKLNYSGIYCGVIVGALEQLQMKVQCDFVKDMLKGDDCYEISVKLQEIIKDTLSDDE
ncbi:bet3 transport protein, putative [Theileria equi strain WA]|uniref:Trafficking protein particle complex subunit n=1 Tax=Theileria equi strain WA TaxID=1537102 RepID=L0AXG6_THEEQ|nr:bet3 transport protein, putative [Theileria equi strain WA]AFZ80260.1 bet3 transport protein, putative [Theileria equi strain WA]|eukprot:XP_004829926.1 bet3 transport protein, putative [Theileria equi strain WA]